MTCCKTISVYFCERNLRTRSFLPLYWTIMRRWRSLKHDLLGYKSWHHASIDKNSYCFLWDKLVTISCINTKSILHFLFFYHKKNLLSVMMIVVNLTPEICAMHSCLIFNILLFKLLTIVIWLKTAFSIFTF